MLLVLSFVKFGMLAVSPSSGVEEGPHYIFLNSNKAMCNS